MTGSAPTIVAVVAGAALLAAGCGGGAPADDHVLRIAMPVPGEAQAGAWNGIAQQFMTSHADTRVEISYLPADRYATAGLPGLLAGAEAPDIYLEWTGDRLAARLTDGVVADLTPAFAPGGALAGLFDDAALSQYRVAGRIPMVPYTSDVANVLWYSQQLLSDAGMEPPTTWDELLAACDTLNGKGLVPIAAGNRDLRAAGNWLAHLVSRVVGEDSYAKVLGGTGTFDTPEWEQAFGYIATLAGHRCVNADAGTIDAAAGEQLFFRGRAVMLAAGSGLVDRAIHQAPDLAFNFVNLPSMPGAAGMQGSIIGSATGFVVNAKSARPTEATAFLALLNGDAAVKALVDAGVTPLATSASAAAHIDNRVSRLAMLLEQAPAIVLPADLGYDHATADAFYAAIAAVLDGQATPADALKGIDRTLGRK